MIGSLNTIPSAFGRRWRVALCLATLCAAIPLSAALAQAPQPPKEHPRPSIEERYAGQEEYLLRVREACDALVAERLLLDEDVPYVMQLLEKQWQEAMTRA